MSALVNRQDHGRVAVLTLAAPPYNAASYPMFLELDAHIVALRMDGNIDVVVIRGQGDRYFCVGAHVPTLAAMTPAERSAAALFAQETLRRIERTPKLFIAALNGHAVGGGLELALACDLRVARDRGDGKPDLVGLPEVELGMLPGNGGTARLARAIGAGRALEWMVSGRRMPVARTVELGLVHAVLPDAHWSDAVLDLAERYCRPNRSPAAVGAIKRAVLAGVDSDVDSALSLEHALQSELTGSPDAVEGFAAFIERRAPNFQVPGDARAPQPVAAAAAHRPATPRPAAPPASAPLPAPASAPRRASPNARAAAPAPTRARPAAAPKPSTPPTGLVITTPSLDDESSAFGGGSPGTERPQAGAAPHVNVAPPRINIPDGFEEFDQQDNGELSDWEFDNAFAGTGAPTDRPESADPGGRASGGFNLRRVRIPDAVLNLIPRSIVERYRCVPVYVTETTIAVAMVQPGDEKAIAEIAEETGLEVQPLRAAEVDVLTVIAEQYRA